MGEIFFNIIFKPTSKSNFYVLKLLLIRDSLQTTTTTNFFVRQAIRTLSDWLIHSFTLYQIVYAWAQASNVAIDTFFYSALSSNHSHSNKPYAFWWDDARAESRVAPGPQYLEKQKVLFHLEIEIKTEKSSFVVFDAARSLGVQFAI